MQRSTVYHPGLGQNVDFQPTFLSDDPDTQVAQTVDLMGKYVRHDAADERIRADAFSALQSDDPVADIFYHVKRRLAFIHDEDLARPYGPAKWEITEALIPPAAMVRMCDAGQCHPQGDCDDFSMYVACLLRVLGYAPKFVTVAADSSQPGRYSHVYAVVYTTHQPQPAAANRRQPSRIPLDCSHGQFPGWEVPASSVTRKREWDIDGCSFGTALALGSIALSAYAIWGRSLR